MSDIARCAMCGRSLIALPKRAVTGKEAFLNYQMYQAIHDPEETPELTDLLCLRCFGKTRPSNRNITASVMERAERGEEIPSEPFPQGLLLRSRFLEVPSSSKGRRSPSPKRKLSTSPPESAFKVLKSPRVGRKSASKVPVVVVRGLRNKNGENLCFANSVIQCLASCPEWMGFVGACIPNPPFPVFTALQNILNGVAQQGLRTLSVISLINEMNRFGGIGQQFARGVQHDSGEFLMRLVTLISENATLPQALRTCFIGTVKERCQCSHCFGHWMTAVEDFTILYCPVPAIDIPSALRGYLATAQRVQDCPLCMERNVNVSVNRVIVTGPNTLVLGLSRYSRGGKISTPVRVPTELYVPTAAGPLRYYLKAVSMHHGENLGEGHYTAVGKRQDGWFYFNDEETQESTSFDSDISVSDVYLTFWEQSTTAQVGAAATTGHSVPSFSSSAPSPQIPTPPTKQSRNSSPPLPNTRQSRGFVKCLLHNPSGIHYVPDSDAERLLDQLVGRGFIFDSTVTYADGSNRPPIVWKGNSKHVCCYTYNHKYGMLGLTAGESIRSGEIIGMYSGVVITEAEEQIRSRNRKSAYCMLFREKRDGELNHLYIDCMDRGNEMRFCNNHCSDPNATFVYRFLNKDGMLFKPKWVTSETGKRFQGLRDGEEEVVMIQAMKYIPIGTPIEICYTGEEVPMEDRYKLEDENGIPLHCLCSSPYHLIGVGAVEELPTF